jgi:hypothetical protein
MRISDLDEGKFIRTESVTGMEIPISSVPPSHIYLNAKLCASKMQETILRHVVTAVKTSNLT